MPDPVTAAFSLVAHHDETYKNLSFVGTFGLSSCSNIVIDTGLVGGTMHGEHCWIGATSGGVPSTGITVRGIHFHDMTIDATTPVEHQEAIFASCVNGLTIEACTFELIYGNTASLFFTGFEVPGVVANHVTVRGCHFLPTTNGVHTDAIQWNDSNGVFHDYLLEGNLFDGSGPSFGMAKNRPVTNFVVGVNYGDTPSPYQVQYAESLGIRFLELPFRDKSRWPGLVKPIPPPADPRDATIAALRAKIGQAQKDLA